MKSSRDGGGPHPVAAPGTPQPQPGAPGPDGARRARGLFDRFAGAATRVSGNSFTFMLAVAVVVVWAVSGPLFGFSETWQLVINTGTTIVTFLMVFVIQHAQNKDSRAVHLKLNELLASHARASNRLVAVEDLDEESLEQLHRFYGQLAELAERAGGVKASHSFDEAEQLHSRKQRIRRRASFETPYR